MGESSEVLFGVVWSGLVWSGLVWSGLALYGLLCQGCPTNCTRSTWRANLASARISGRKP
jgi:hypothetical protein